MAETFLPASSSVSQATYERETQTLKVTFQDGRSYQYENVPVTVWQGLQNAASAGSYVRRQIVGVYDYMEI